MWMLDGPCSRKASSDHAVAKLESHTAAWYVGLLVERGRKGCVRERTRSTQIMRSHISEAKAKNCE